MKLQLNVLMGLIIAGIYLVLLIILAMIIIPNVWYLNVWITLFIVVLHLVAKHTVPVGHEGVLTILGSRASRFLKSGVFLLEGIYIPLIFLSVGIIDVDVRIRRARITRDGGTLGSEGSAQAPIEIQPIADMTKDKIRSFAEMAWTFEVMDADQFLSVEDPFKNAISAVDARTRNIIRALEADNLAVIPQSEFLNGRAGEFEGILAPSALPEDLDKWGLKISNFFLQGIRFTDKVEGERELRYREEQQQNAEDLEFQRTNQRVETVVMRQDLDPAEAWENEMSRQGKPLRESFSFRTRKGHPTVGDIAAEIGMGLGFKERVGKGAQRKPSQKDFEEEEGQQ